MVTTVDYFEGVAEVCRAEATFSQVYKSSMRNLAQFGRYRQEWPTASVGLDRLLHLFADLPVPQAHIMTPDLVFARGS